MILDIIGLLIQSSLFHEAMNHYTMCSTFMRCCSWTFRWKHLQDRECRLSKIDEGERLRWTVISYTMYVNQADVKVKPCCVFMKIHLRRSFAGTCLSQLVGAELFEGDALIIISNCWHPNFHIFSKKSLRWKTAWAVPCLQLELAGCWNAIVFQCMVDTRNTIAIYCKHMFFSCPR